MSRTRSSRSAANRMVCGRRFRRRPMAAPMAASTAESTSEANAELVEPPPHPVGRRLEQAGDGAEIFRPDGEDAAVEVLALHLDHAEVARQQVALRGSQLLEPGEGDS